MLHNGHLPGASTRQVFILIIHVLSAFRCAARTVSRLIPKRHTRGSIPVGGHFPVRRPRPHGPAGRSVPLSRRLGGRSGHHPQQEHPTPSTLGRPARYKPPSCWELLQFYTYPQNSRIRALTPLEFLVASDAHNPLQVACPRSLTRQEAIMRTLPSGYHNTLDNPICTVITCDVTQK